MNLKRIQSLWKENETERGRSVEDPSEARFRVWVLVVAMLAAPPLLFMLYYKTMFPGLTNLEALDFAQLGRNLSAGHGFITYVLRPLALTHGAHPFGEPDTTHGPLFPFILALAFGLKGSSDQTVAMVSGLFYLLTIPVLYTLGVRAFNRAVALLTVLLYTCNALMLEYASCGLHITLFIFLMTCLLLAIYNAAAKPETDDGLPRRASLKPWPYFIAGAVTALLYLTDPLFFWLCPIVLISVYFLSDHKKASAVLVCALPMALLALPWMMRNYTLTGNPVFGLRGMELWMYTKGFYPGDSAYRRFASEMIPSTGLFESVVHKILLGGGQVIQQFPQVTASWILAFFLPCLLFRYSDPAANKLRQIMIFCMLGILLGTVVFQIWMPLFVAVIPVMMLFSVSYLIHLAQQAQLKHGSVALVTSLVAVAAIYPLVSDVVLKDKYPPLDGMESARDLGKLANKTDVVLSDQPATVAWYAERPSVFVPSSMTETWPRPARLVFLICAGCS